MDYEVYKALKKPRASLWPSTVAVWDNDGSSGYGTGNWKTRRQRTGWSDLGVRKPTYLLHGTKSINPNSDGWHFTAEKRRLENSQDAVFHLV